MDFFNRLCCRIDGFEDDKCLTFRFDVLFGDNVDDGAIFLEEFAQGFGEMGDLDSLVKVSYL